MKKISINKSRFFAQVKVGTFSYNKFDADEVLSVLEVLTPKSKMVNGKERFNDSLLVTNSEGAKFRLPISDLTRMELIAGQSLYTSEDDSESLDLPNQITIVSSKDREFEGDIVYPLFAYKRAQEFLDGMDDDEPSVSWAELVKEGDLNDDNTLKPVQNYTISVK